MFLREVPEKSWLCSCSFNVSGSSSPNCSARSPVSLHESSDWEPTWEDDRESDERRRPLSSFSSDAAPTVGPGWEDLLAWDERLRKGIFAGRREAPEEGILDKFAD